MQYFAEVFLYIFFFLSESGNALLVPVSLISKYCVEIRLSFSFLQVTRKLVTLLVHQMQLKLCRNLFVQLLVAGGGMYVEVFNRGVIPLAYGIRKKNKAGESNTYLDGIYLLFTYFTKPESMSILEETLLADDDVIRSSSFKIRKRKVV